MKCPQCGQNQAYRSHPQSLTVYCSVCKHSWESNQPQRPILKQRVWCSKGLRGWHQITVWLCPNDKLRYSYAISCGAGGVQAFYEYQEDPYRSCNFATSTEAIEAAIKNTHRIILSNSLPLHLATNNFKEVLMQNIDPIRAYLNSIGCYPLLTPLQEVELGDQSTKSDRS